MKREARMVSITVVCLWVSIFMQKTLTYSRYLFKWLWDDLSTNNSHSEYAKIRESVKI